jgi:flagellin
MANSINTNVGAMVALQNLNSTNRQLDKVQNRVSTGLRVSSAIDDASSFAIAEGVRADIKAYRAVSQSLAQGKGLSKVALAGAEQISSLIGDIKAKITEGLNAGNTSQSQSILDADFQSLTDQLTTFISNASYNGVNLLSSGASDKSVIANIDGSSLTVRAQSGVNTVSSNLAAQSLTSTANALTALSALSIAQASIATALGQLGADTRALEFQDTFVQTLSDANEEGLGAIVDADLAKESARLQSLQVRQQLGVQTLGIANQAPQSLLGLFR